MQSISGQEEESLPAGAVPVDSINHTRNLGMRITGVEPTCTGWTDEKHSMYLSFMEASFVNQLYNHDFSSVLSPDVQSRQKNPSGQFKVLQSGNWKISRIRRSGNQLDLEGAPDVLWANQWVRHFSPLSHGKKPETKMSNRQNNSMLVSSRACLEEERLSNKEFPAVACTKVCPATYFPNSVNQNAEVSDQNFIDGNYDSELDQNSNLHQKKKLRTERNYFLSRDQVVPSADFDPIQSIHSERAKEDSYEHREYTDGDAYYYADAMSRI